MHVRMEGYVCHYLLFLFINIRSNPVLQRFRHLNVSAIFLNDIVMVCYEWCVGIFTVLSRANNTSIWKKFFIRSLNLSFEIIALYLSLNTSVQDKGFLLWYAIRSDRQPPGVIVGCLIYRCWDVDLRSAPTNEIEIRPIFSQGIVPVFDVYRKCYGHAICNVSACINIYNNRGSRHLIYLVDMMIRL